MCELDHPGIPRITEQMEDDSFFYIVMDYCKGESLWNLCNHKKVAMNEIISWGIQLCDILNYLHEQKPPIIFRDIKPGNIICDEYNRLKLVDFGIAKTDDSGFDYDRERINVHDMGKGEKAPVKTAESEAGDAKGTRGFAAPEQYKGKYSVRSDIYNLGATLLWCMKGQSFRTLKKILKKAISKEPEQRYKDCHSLKKKLLLLQKKRKNQKYKAAVWGLCMLAFIGVKVKYVDINGQNGIIEKIEQFLETVSEEEGTEEHVQEFFEQLDCINTLFLEEYENEKHRYIENLQVKKTSLNHLLENLEGGNE